MKALRFALIFSVIASALIGSLFMLELIDQAQSVDYLGKLVGVILILGVSISLISILSGKPSAPANTSATADAGNHQNSGPNFNS